MSGKGSLNSARCSLRWPMPNKLKSICAGTGGGSGVAAAAGCGRCVQWHRLHSCAPSQHPACAPTCLELQQKGQMGLMGLQPPAPDHPAAQQLRGAAHVLGVVPARNSAWDQAQHDKREEGHEGGPLNGLCR